MSRLSIFPGADRPLVFGHRGFSSRAPENTLASFAAALEHRVPGVEFDVHRCASGELVVIHDSELTRLSGVPGTVEAMTLDELKSRDVGVWFSELFRGERVPLLEEVFELLSDRVYYDIEIKHDRRNDPGIAEAVVSLVRARGLTERVCLSSFNPYAIRSLKDLAPEIPSAIIYSNSRELPWILRRGFGRFIGRAAILKPSRKLVTRGSMILDSTIAGHPVIPWTVNTEAEAVRLLSLGVDGLISDDPVMIMRTVETYRNARVR